MDTLVFEIVPTNLGDTLRRTRVPGGWLVAITSDVVHTTEVNGIQSGWDWRTSLTFVPDPEHQWR